MLCHTASSVMFFAPLIRALSPRGSAPPAPSYRPQPQDPPQAPSYPPGQSPAPGTGPGFGAGGSFLGTAASTAAGVIGGGLLLNSIRSMFGEHAGLGGHERSALDSASGGDAAIGDIRLETMKREGLMGSAKGTRTARRRCCSGVSKCLGGISGLSTPIQWLVCARPQRLARRRVTSAVAAALALIDTCDVRSGASVASFRHDDRHDALPSLSLSGTPLPHRPSAFWGTLALRRCQDEFRSGAEMREELLRHCDQRNSANRS
jgi:hypothetical protein